MSETSLVIMTRASRMLAEANTIQKAKELRDMAIVAGEWAKRKKMGEEAIQHCRSYAMRAEIKMGEMLAQTERADGGEALRPLLHRVTGPPPTLSELGITRRESAEAQMLAELPKEKQEEVIAGKLTPKAARREKQKNSVLRKSSPIPTSKFRVIYADPPWKYGDQLTEDYGATRFHYPSMNLAELGALPVANLAENNAVLFLWVTAPILPECFQIIKAWGFTYKTNFIWNKDAHNMGHYSSVRHEHLILATRGSCLPDVKTLIPSVVTVKRTGHSAKPERFREIIDLLYPNGKRIELFARKNMAKGWEFWGNEIP